MNPSLATSRIEEPAPATLRSPPSTLRVRDRTMRVELAEHADLAPHQDYEPPTRRYARVA